MPSESLTWQLCPVVRASFHAVLHSGIDAVSLAAAMQEFSQTVEELRQAHQLLTASLFRYQAHLFLYLESVGTALAPDGCRPCWMHCFAHGPLPWAKPCPAAG